MAATKGRDGMGIGQRLQQLFGGGSPPAEGDPGAMREAAVVLLVDGPMLLERLRDRGVEAVGIESVDPVTGVRSYMRIMVRQSDLLAANQTIEERRDEDSAGMALGTLDDGGGEEDAAAEEEAQRAMSRLFLAADRLGNQPADVELVAEVEQLGALVTGSAPPFGVEPGAWKRMASLAAAVVAADQTDDEDEVRAAARALRDFLREYV